MDYNITLAIIAIIVFAIWMINYLTGCTHSWKVIQSYEVLRSRDKKPVGYMHVKECEYCKDIKKQEVTIDT